jgi:hypothetical protein
MAKTRKRPFASVARRLGSDDVLTLRDDSTPAARANGHAGFALCTQCKFCTFIRMCACVRACVRAALDYGFGFIC